MTLLLLILAGALQAPASTTSGIEIEDPRLRSAVERFFQMQEEKDVDGYLSLWSATANKPTAEQLKFIFDRGDDRFSDIAVVRVLPAGSRMRVRVRARRVRSMSATPGGERQMAMTIMYVALTYVNEDGDWKLLREGPAADDLAHEILEASTDEARDALLAAEPELAGLPLLGSLARLGSAAAMRQDFARAETIFERVIALAGRWGHRKEQGEALQNLANALYYQRRFPEARRAYEDRLAIERERGDDVAIAAAISGLATIRYSTGEYVEALAGYRQALAIQELVNDAAGVAFSMLSIGNITYLQGDFEASIAAYRRALELNRTMSHADGEALALEGLGRVYFAQGNYIAALDAFETVLADPRLQAHRARLGSAARSAADVHFRLGNLDAAQDGYDTSRSHFKAVNDMSNVGRVTQALALTELVSGRYLPAEDLYLESRSVCAAAEDMDCAARATVGLGYAQAAQDKFADAAASYRRAVAEFTALDHREDAARAEVGLSQTLAGAGDLAAALDAALRARSLAEAASSDDVLWRALTAEARVRRKRGEKDAALQSAVDAVRIVDRLQNQALERPGGVLATDAAAALATYAVLQAESGDPAGAFSTAEKLRAIDIRGSLATNERDIARGMTPEERDQERALDAELSTRLAQLSRETGQPVPDAARVAELTSAVEAAKAARSAFRERLFERLPDLRAWRGLLPERTARDTAPLLDAGTVLLAFVLDDDDLLVLTVTRPQALDEGLHDPVVEAHVVPVRRKDVVEAVARLQHPAAAADRDAWDEAAREVASLLPPAVARRLAKASRVLVVPHDVLWRVPFDALPSGKGYLLDGATVTIAGSADSLLRSAALWPGGGAGAVIVGAPEFSAERSARLRQLAPGWLLAPPGRSGAEIEAAAGAYAQGRVDIVRQSDASEPRVRASAAGAAVLHIAAPFRINAASPLFSPILLTAPPSTEGPDVRNSSSAPILLDPADDGALELREVMDLDLHSRVVVLSDGAATSMRDGAAAADVLQWGWLAAGVPTVLVSRWTSPSSDRLLGIFHERLEGGASPAEALRAAQLAVRANEAASAPLHWAGWMLLGAR